MLPKVTLSKMDGCSFCHQMEQKMGHMPNVQVVTCHGKNATPDHAACKNVSAFPSFHDAKGNMCHQGAGDVHDIMKKCTGGK